MKRLILVRHGDYADGTLTDHGREQMQELAPALGQSVVGNILLVSSPIQRAKESAAILAEYFNVPVHEHEVWEAEGDWSDNRGALQFVVNIDTNVDTLMVVTHLPFLESFPGCFGKKTLDTALPYGGVDKGQAQVIDCEMKTMTRVTPALTKNKDEAPPVRPTLLSTPGTRGSHTREQAENYVAMLKQVVATNRLKKVYLFGSIAKYGSGNDVDLVLEVPHKVFLEFASACVGALDGFHPVTAQLLPWASAYWDYASPKEMRAKYALNALAVPPDAVDGLAEIVPYAKIDILCLPIGWKDKTDVNKVLNTAFGFGKDPDLLQHVIESAVELR